MKQLIIKKGLVLVVFATLFNLKVKAQQDPQYTQYMYNTMSVNPAYAGQRERLSINSLYRTQWVGIDGAPKTLSFSAHTPIEGKREDRVGLGLSVVSDQLGPAKETYVDANFSYTIPVSYSGNIGLSFGIKGGFHLLDTDWSRGIYQNPDNAFNENLSLFSPTVGAGLYLHSEDWYFGVSVPNLINTKHYDDFQESLSVEKKHYFIMGGYVFDLSDRTKFKPAFLVKAVSGSPAIADISANFLFYDKLTLGAAWRWDDSVSGLAGFQISRDLFIGYSFDYTTTNLNNYNSGTHEVMLRFEIPKRHKRLLSPRFF